MRFYKEFMWITIRRWSGRRQFRAICTLWAPNNNSLNCIDRHHYIHCGIIVFTRWQYHHRSGRSDRFTESLFISKYSRCSLSSFFIVHEPSIPRMLLWLSDNIPSQSSTIGTRKNRANCVTRFTQQPPTRTIWEGDEIGNNSANEAANFFGWGV